LIRRENQPGRFCGASGRAWRDARGGVGEEDCRGEGLSPYVLLSTREK